MAVKTKFIQLLFLLSLSFTASAQTGEADSSALQKLPPLFSVGVGVQHGFIFAHSPEVENTKGANPTGIEVALSWQRNDPATWELCNCFPRKGLLLAYYDYDTKVLGKSYTAAFFLEPLYKLGKKTFFSFRASAGVSYLTNPFDSIKNPTNRSYSTSLSMYALVGIGAWFRVTNNIWMNASLNYQHESNGGLKQPNKGINWPTAGLMLSYQPTYREYNTMERSKEKYWRDQTLRHDFIFFGMPKRGIDEHGNSRRLPLIGAGYQVAKQVGRINNLTLGTEIYRDASLKAQLQQQQIEASPVKAGMLAGHEFILGKFLFSQRLGIYLFDQTPYYDLIFHRWGLMYRANRHLGVGFNLQAHRQVADFIDLRLTYMLQKQTK